MTLQPCLTCGDLAEAPRCRACSPTTTEQRGTSPHQRGYDHAWRRLSLQARRTQPFCSDCGGQERLTADHLPSAWERKERGLPLRLEDVDVVCNDCNVRRGSSRPGSARALGGGPARGSFAPGAQGQLQISLAVQAGAPANHPVDNPLDDRVQALDARWTPNTREIERPWTTLDDPWTTPAPVSTRPRAYVVRAVDGRTPRTGQVAG